MIDTSSVILRMTPSPKGKFSATRDYDSIISFREANETFPFGEGGFAAGKDG